MGFGSSEIVQLESSCLWKIWCYNAGASCMPGPSHFLSVISISHHGNCARQRALYPEYMKVRHRSRVAHRADPCSRDSSLSANPKGNALGSMENAQHFDSLGFDITVVDILFWLVGLVGYATVLDKVLIAFVVIVPIKNQHSRSIYPDCLKVQEWMESMCLNILQMHLFPSDDVYAKSSVVGALNIDQCWCIL